MGGTPPAKHAYQILTVHDRTETPDSIFISYDALIQKTTTITPSSWIYPINCDPIRFKKGNLIWEKPRNYAMRKHISYPSGDRATEKMLTVYDSMPQFATHENFVSYCDTCRCYGV